VKEHFIYTKAGTDITKRWKALYNYVPASETEEVKQKWAEFKAIMARTLDDVEKESKWVSQSNWL
jgi:hypothetical protein